MSYVEMKLSYTKLQVIRIKCVSFDVSWDPRQDRYTGAIVHENLSK